MLESYALLWSWKCFDNIYDHSKDDVYPAPIGGGLCSSLHWTFVIQRNVIKVAVFESFHYMKIDCCRDVVRRLGGKFGDNIAEINKVCEFWILICCYFMGILFIRTTHLEMVRWAKYFSAISVAYIYIQFWNILFLSPNPPLLHTNTTFSYRNKNTGKNGYQLHGFS